MPISRRSLLSRGTVFIAGCSMLPIAGFAAPLTALVPMSVADETVLAWVRGYASAVRLAGSGVVGKLRASAKHTTHILARVDSTALLFGALAGPLPFAGAPVYTKENTFKVTFAGTEFTIENLLPAAYTKALASRSARATTNFATDGVLWDPITHALSDPFHATGVPSLKLVSPGTTWLAIFTTLLRSLTESDAANVGFDVSLSAYHRRAMAHTSLTKTESAAIFAELIQQLPTVADQRPAQEVTALILSPLVNATLHRQLGVLAVAVYLQFTALRATAAAAISDAGVWLAVLLAPQIRAGTASIFAGGLAPEMQGRFVAALAEAAQLL